MFLSDKFFLFIFRQDNRIIVKRLQGVRDPI